MVIYMPIDDQVTPTFLSTDELETYGDDWRMVKLMAGCFAHITLKSYSRSSSFLFNNLFGGIPHVKTKPCEHLIVEYPIWFQSY